MLGPCSCSTDSLTRTARALWQCDECSPGCSWDMLHNDQCDEQCFTEECRWDALACGSELANDALHCPVALDPDHALVPIIGAGVGSLLPLLALVGH